MSTSSVGALGRGWASAVDWIGVGASLDVFDEGRAGRLPPEQLAGDRARGGHVETDELADEAEAHVGLLGRDGGRRQPEAAAERLGDITHRDALLGDGVQHRALGGALDAEPDKACGVTAVDGGPAVLAVAYVANGAVVAVG